MQFARKYVLLLLFLTGFALIIPGCGQDEQKFHLGVLQWTEKVQPYQQTYQGIIDSLSDSGFKTDINLEIDYLNVEQDQIKAFNGARNFVTEKVDLIVALGTGSSLAALKATNLNRVPIVFSIVGAPKATGIIESYDQSGRNITGVSMKIPVQEQFQQINDILPNIKKCGILYTSEMVQAVATAQEAIDIAPTFGWKSIPVILSKQDLHSLRNTVQTLAEQVDLIYIPTDPVLSSPDYLNTIIEVADKNQIPVIGVAKKFVENGILAAIHCDYYEIGRQTGNSIIRILRGVKVQNIPSKKPMITRLSLNLQKAQQLNIKIPRAVILKADNLIN